MFLILRLIRRLFCRHDWKLCRRIGAGFAAINGEQLYRRCTKCDKVENIFLQNMKVVAIDETD